MKYNFKFNMNDNVILDYGGGYGVISKITAMKIDCNGNESYEIEDRPGNYWSVDRITLNERSDQQ
ncbi:MAG: hypothetical protein ACOCZ5_02890 [bacterium]